jgi:hypothetical protein
MENWRENLSLISKLKVAGNPSDALATRLFFERLFTAADFHPPGISQRAIVCIKKINAPPVKNSRFAYSTLEWEKGVRESVEKLYRRAFRPSREAVPAQAESVIFEDKSELLACLARDWCCGALAENWWWRAIFPHLSRAETVAKIWLDAAEFVPFALHFLVQTADAEKFVKRLQPAETIELLQRIVRLFGLDKLESALFQPLEKKEKFEIEAQIKRAGKSFFGSTANLMIPAKFETFFKNLLPDTATSDLSFYQQSLLEIALLLTRSPRVVRSAEFAERIKIYRIKSDFGKTISGRTAAAIFGKKKNFKESDKPSEKTAKRLPEKSEIQPGQPKQAKSETYVSSESKSGEKKFRKRQIERKKSLDLTSELVVEPEKKQATEKPEKISFEASEPEKRVEKTAQKVNREKFIKSAAQKELFKDLIEDFETELEYRFQTRFGGVFYLLNLGLYLGLYHDFTESLSAEIDLNIWDFTALLGLEFLGEEIKTDAVWDFLKFAAQRENDEEFGRGFNQSQDWRVPTEWLETFPKNQKWFFMETKKRLVIRHPEGFNIVDVARRGVAENQLKNELEIYQNYYSEISQAGKKDLHSAKSKKWLKNLAEFLEKRLFQALNLQSARELNAILFERQADVTVSGTHLEITFGLADLPFEVRLAGIDRNPGWIPAAGKYVYFYFV